MLTSLGFGVLKAGQFRKKIERDAAGGAVALFGDDELRFGALLEDIEDEATANSRLFQAAGELSVWPILFFKPGGGMKPGAIRLEPGMGYPSEDPQSVNVIGSPVDINGSPSTAVLSGTSYSALDSTVFTVVPDPNTPNGAIITAIGAGSTTLTETATATEPDGVTTETVQGVATIVVTAVPPPPPPVAASLVFTFGTPFVPAAPAAPAAASK